MDLKRKIYKGQHWKRKFLKNIFKGRPAQKSVDFLRIFLRDQRIFWTFFGDRAKILLFLYNGFNFFSGDKRGLFEVKIMNFF